jgi:sigma-B regulation protein RsbU (phosphoserine phosphatase)
VESAPVPLRLLLVEDSSKDAKLLIRKLEQAGFRPETLIVDHAQALRDALRSQTWDLVVSDYELPTLDAPEAVSIVRATGIDLPVIVISGKVGEESAVAVMRGRAPAKNNKQHQKTNKT